METLHLRRVRAFQRLLKKEMNTESYRVLFAPFNLIIFPQKEEDDDRLDRVVVGKFINCEDRRFFFSKVKDSIDKLRTLRLQYDFDVLLIIRFGMSQPDPVSYTIVPLTAKQLPASIYSNPEQKISFVQV